MQDLVTSIAQAIIRMENVNPRFNNPGAIFDIQNNRLRQYATYEEGYNALLRQVRLNISRGLTLEEFFGGKPGVYPGYAPKGPGIHSTNNPQHYANLVSQWTGIPLGQNLNQITAGVVATATPTATTAPTPTPTIPGGSNTLSPGTQLPNVASLPNPSTYWADGANDPDTGAVALAVGLGIVGLLLLTMG